MPRLRRVPVYQIRSQFCFAELGYRGTGDVLKREEFEARKKADREKHLHKDAPPKPLASMGKDLGFKPFLQVGRSLERGRETQVHFLVLLDKVVE